jgi:hypothetical protein
MSRQIRRVRSTDYTISYWPAVKKFAIGTPHQNTDRVPKSIFSNLSGLGAGVEKSVVAGSKRPFRNRLSSVQLIEQRLGLLQVKRVEAFGEPTIDRREKITGFAAPVLLAPEAR